MNVGPGTRLLHYEVRTSVGKGGMGEVFRARDTKLGREVAIKVLPEEFTKDAERLARFDREARVLASLNHSHIASIYGFEEEDGIRFLVMELAEGEDLAVVLARGPLPVEDAIDFAKQIATALDAAHEKGIVHRDLKPANVMVTGEGQIRVLDFGLAKALDTEEGDEDFSNSPTMVRAATHAGMILGTAAYMSPEQARGKVVDKRADIWAFGVVLWEMLTGRRPFGGETVSDTLASVLKEEPDWDELPDDVPRNVRHVIRRCLTKKPSDRLRDIGDALFELSEPADDLPDGPPAQSATEARGVMRWLPWLLVGVAAILLIASLAFRESRTTELPLRKLTALVESENEERSATLSPDGRYIAYIDKESILIRSLDSREARRVAPRKDNWGVLFWSPDSKWIVFDGDEKLWKVPAERGTPSLICNVPPERESICGAWGKNDRLVLCQWRGGLLEVSANGGTLTEFMPAADDLVDYHDIYFLPDGETLLGLPHLTDDIASIEVIRGKERRTLLSLEGENFNGLAAYSPTGHLLVGRRVEVGVWAIPFSLETIEVTGEPFIVAAGGAYPSVSNDGSLLYRSDIEQDPSQIVRVSMDGAIVGTIGEPAESVTAPLFSPDGHRLAYAAREKRNEEVFLLDLESGATRRLTVSEPGVENHPEAWTPDGEQLLIGRRVSGNWGSPENGLWILAVDGTSELRKIAQLGSGGNFLPDGKTLVYNRFSIRNDDDLFWTRIDGENEPTVIIESPHSEDDVAVSPDGRLVAFASNESGQSEIWATRFPDANGRRQISSGGGRAPVWSPDGRTLYYRNEDVYYAMPVSGGASPSFGAPQRLFDRSEKKLGWLSLSSVESEFVMVQDLPTNRAYVYVQNWFTEFEK